MVQTHQAKIGHHFLWPPMERNTKTCTVIHIYLYYMYSWWDKILGKIGRVVYHSLTAIHHFNWKKEIDFKVRLNTGVYQGSIKIIMMDYNDQTDLLIMDCIGSNLMINLIEWLKFTLPAWHLFQRWYTTSTWKLFKHIIHFLMQFVWRMGSGDLYGDFQCNFKCVEEPLL